MGTMNGLTQQIVLDIPDYAYPIKHSSYTASRDELFKMMIVFRRRHKLFLVHCCIRNLAI